MRKLNLISGALGVTALALTACSNEMPVNDNGVAQKDEVRFMRVAIANATGTRADEQFQDGIGKENDVNNMYFRLYDSNGKAISAETAVLGDLTDVNVTGQNGNVGAIKQAVLQISIPRNTNYPAYVVCFINPVSYDEISDDANMEALRNLIRKDYSDGEYFAMTNSVYFGNDPISGATDVKMSGAPIQASQLYTTKEAAEDGDASVVNIYVERYAAKVNFTLEADAISDYVYGGYNMTFVPEFWTINAASPNMYAIKRYADDNSATTSIPTMESVDKMLQGWDTWNDPANFRSYWACSPSFYASEFPQVSDNIIDKVAEGQTGAGVAVAPYSLCYYSYNQIAGKDNYNGFGKGMTVTPGTSNYKYALENTMGKDAFASLNPKAAAPSVVLVGNYKLTKGTTEIPANTGFCLYNSNLYYVKDAPAADSDTKTIMQALLDANRVLYTAGTTPGTYTRLSSANLPETMANLFEVVHPSASVRGQQVVPHRYVTLQLKQGTTNFTGLYYRPDGAADYIPVEVNAGQTAAQVVDQINFLLWQQLGNASQYTDGKCYFSIPIQHLGYTESEDGAPETNGVLDWKKVKVGDFGLVRNHVYNIVVDEIKGRADGIQGLDNPLVPSMESTDMWIKYRVNILNWRVVPTQGVKL